MPDADSGKETQSGQVTSIIYQNSNGFTILEITDEDGGLVTLKGTMPDIHPGEYIQAQGAFEDNEIYGPQFVVSAYAVSLPSRKVDMERYLVSFINGVGPATAKAIIETFGDKTYDVLANEPERLTQLKGISEQRAVQISEQFRSQASSRQAMIYLESLGITPYMAMRIYKTLGPHTQSIVQENPYVLAEKVEGFGFKRADEIASRSGLEPTSPFRVSAVLRYALLQMAGEGHTYYPREDLVRYVEQETGLETALIERCLSAEELKGKIICKDDDKLYLPVYYNAEMYVAGKLSKLLTYHPTVDRGKLSEQIQAVERSEDLVLSEEQRKAVEQGMESSVLVITGGPGTGKTTIIRALISLIERNDKEFLLAAPTGKAAKRMEEATGASASTIHRLLEVEPGEEGGLTHFKNNEDHPLETDYVIIDEMSMVDINLMHHLLAAVPVGTGLILLGDKDQLPSVGAGNVLRDIIESGVVPVMRLSHIYRQGSGSGIVNNAHRINEGQYPVFEHGRDNDFFLVTASSPKDASDKLVELVTKRLPKFRHYSVMDDIQVLCPMKKGLAGVIEMNRRLQEKLNPPRKGKGELKAGDMILRAGDKVMQTRNNYNLPWKIENRYHVSVEEGQGVYNGDSGRVEKISAGEVLVRFSDSRLVSYDMQTVHELQLSYAITVHKSQGTESPVIVLPVVDTIPMLMTRNLLYTAVTRARKMVVIVGTMDAVSRMVDNNRQERRYSDLSNELKKEQDDPVLGLAVPEALPLMPPDPWEDDES